MAEFEPSPFALFKNAVLSLGILEPLELDRLCSQIEADGKSPIEGLMQSGMASPADVDLVDLMLRADDAIPGYQIQDLIGRGGMGAVWRAKQKSLDRLVALKTVLAVHASDKTNLLRFEREATAISRLSHPNIITALDFGKHHGRLFLAMEYVVGEDLSTFIERQGTLDEGMAWGIARQIAAGLSSASRQGIIHRDIKPANILLVAQSEGYSQTPGVPMVKIADFGLALLQSTHKVVQSRLTSQDSALGSPHYMAPEQLGPDEVDTRVDIYALGASVFQMLVGNPPWQGKSLQQIVRAKLQGPVPSVYDHRQDVSADTVKLVQKMMSLDPSNRHRDCAELIEEITQLQAITPHSVLKASQADLPTQVLHKPTDITQPKIVVENSKVNRFKIDRRWLIGAIGGCCVAVGGIALLNALRFTNGDKVQVVKLIESQGNSESPIYLFDGRNILSKHLILEKGGWSAETGRLVHTSAGSAERIYLIPEWDYFEFAANVQIPNGFVVEFEMKPSKSIEQYSDFTIRMSYDSVQIFKSNGGKQSQVAEIKGFESDRDEHSVVIERNQNTWILKVDDLRDQYVILPFQRKDKIQSQVRMISQRENRASNNPQSVASGVAFSEIEVRRMLVAPATGSP